MKNNQADQMWARCPNCGHKLFKITSPNVDKIGGTARIDVEIKCHSCKSISNLILIRDENGGLTYGTY